MHVYNKQNQKNFFFSSTTAKSPKVHYNVSNARTHVRSLARTHARTHTHVIGGGGGGGSLIVCTIGGGGGVGLVWKSLDVVRIEETLV